MDFICKSQNVAKSCAWLAILSRVREIMALTINNLLQVRFFFSKLQSKTNNIKDATYIM